MGFFEEVILEGGDGVSQGWKGSERVHRGGGELP